MKRLLYSLTVMALLSPVVSAQEFDDIYYNPKKDKTTVKTKTSKKQSNYIKDFENMDVDAYNRRGQYYVSPIDTIGTAAEQGEDFVYTQEIQKFYNPTIVVDNADILEDVLLNSYGNVEIIYDNGIPSFIPCYSTWGWPYYGGYYAWNDPWYWNWGWNRPYWAYGPSWTWGPSWGWGWGPSWSWGWGGPGWGPSWGWGHGPAWGGGRPHYADYRPNGRYPNRPGSNWASNTRPGGNHAGAGNVGRPGSHRVPSNNSGGIYGNTSNYHRNPAGTSTGRGGNRVNGSNGTSTNRGGYTVNQNGHRTYGGGTVNNNSTTNNHRSTNYNRNTNSNRNSYNTNSNYNSNRGSYNTGRSTGGGFGGGGRSTGGGRSSGGGGRGTHR